MELDVLDSGGSAEYCAYKVAEPHWSIDNTACALTKFLIDPPTIQTGFGKIARGMSPDFVWADVAGTKISPPGDDYKPAFQVSVYVSKTNGAPVDGWREWNSVQASARDGIKRIWPEISEGLKNNAGKCAVVSVKGYETVSFGQNSQPCPRFELLGWVENPDVEASPSPSPVAAAKPEGQKAENLF